MTEKTAEERAREVLARETASNGYATGDTGARIYLAALTAAGIALVDAAELEALLTFATKSRKEYVWRRCGEEARRRQCAYRPEQMEQWDKQYAEWWDDEHADVAAILQRRKAVTDD